jgi:hypothetical protein
MKFLCRWFGHVPWSDYQRPSRYRGESYIIASRVGVTDGIGCVHGTLHAECGRQAEYDRWLTT